MTLTPRNLALLAALGSAGLLGGALFSQYFGGLAPCEMCIWQRWPHGIAIALGALILLGLWLRPLAALGAGLMLVGAGLGLFHTGVERRWWEGPGTCSGGQDTGLSTDQLLDQILAAPVVRCDEVAWDFLSLSMASWNAVISLGLAALWLLAATRRG